MIQNHKKLWMMGKCTQKFNQWDTQKPKLFIWGDRFFEKKQARNGFKARNHCLNKDRIWVEHPTFWKDQKKVQTEWLPVLKPSKIISRIKKIYFIYSKRLGNKNSWRFVSAYIFHSKNRHIICIALLWQSSHNSVI